jgi:hypothetical protein
MSELKAQLHEVSRAGEQQTVPAVDGQIEQESEATGTTRNRIALTVRNRLRVLRVAPPIDDGFRPFRVF